MAELEKILNQRLDILEENHVISKVVSDYSRRVVRMILEEKPDAEEDRAAMFITHLAMAGQRVLDGKDENPLDSRILEAVKQEPHYGKAVVFLESMLKETDIAFPGTEKDFLAVHLCNLFS